MSTISHEELVYIGSRILKNNFYCGVVLAEQQSLGVNEIPDVIGFNHNTSILIECKSNRKDFLQDRRKPIRVNPETGMGQFRYFLAPKGVVKNINELPKGWGLIEAMGQGYRTKLICGRKFKSKHFNEEYLFDKYNAIGEKALLYSAMRTIQCGGVTTNFEGK